MSIKLIVSDIDYTLINAHAMPTPRVTQTLRRAAACSRRAISRSISAVSGTASA